MNIPPMEKVPEDDKKIVDQQGFPYGSESKPRDARHPLRPTFGFTAGDYDEYANKSEPGGWYLAGCFWCFFCLGVALGASISC